MDDEYGQLVGNAGFEWGLAKPWGTRVATDDQTPWRNFADFASTAQAETRIRKAGTRSLRIHSQQSAGPGRFAESTQTISTEPDRRYRLTVWVRAKQLASDGGVCLLIGVSDVPELRHRTLLIVPSGTYDWQKLQTEFSFPATSAELVILCRDSGTVWLDELRIQPVDEDDDFSETEGATFPKHHEAAHKETPPDDNGPFSARKELPSATAGDDAGERLEIVHPNGKVEVIEYDAGGDPWLLETRRDFKQGSETEPLLLGVDSGGRDGLGASLGEWLLDRVTSFGDRADGVLRPLSDLSHGNAAEAGRGDPERDEQLQRRRQQGAQETREHLRNLAELVDRSPGNVVSGLAEGAEALSEPNREQRNQDLTNLLERRANQLVEPLQDVFRTTDPVRPADPRRQDESEQLGREPLRTRLHGRVPWRDQRQKIQGILDMTVDVKQQSFAATFNGGSINGGASADCLSGSFSGQYSGDDHNGTLAGTGTIYLRLELDDRTVNIPVRYQVRGRMQNRIVDGTIRSPKTQFEYRVTME